MDLIAQFEGNSCFFKFLFRKLFRGFLTFSFCIELLFHNFDSLSVKSKIFVLLVQQKLRCNRQNVLTEIKRSKFRSLYIGLVFLNLELWDREISFLLGFF